MSKCWNLKSSCQIPNFLLSVSANITVTLLRLHILPATSSPLNFAFSPHVLTPKSSPLSSPLALIPNSGQCGVSGSGCCCLVGVGGGGVLKKEWGWGGGGGVMESLQTLGASPSPGQTKWQRDSAKEVSPFTKVSQLRGGQSTWQRSTNRANTHTDELIVCCVLKTVTWHDYMHYVHL